MKRLLIILFCMALLSSISSAADEPAVSEEKAMEKAVIEDLLNDPKISQELKEPGSEKSSETSPAPEPEKKEKSLVSPSDQVMQERQALTEHFESRVVPSGQSVEMRETKGGLEILLRHDQLFLPGLDILRDNALSQLQEAVEKIKANPGKKVILKSIARYRGEKPLAFTSTVPFSMTEGIHGPNTRRAEIQSITSESKDLEAHRSVILFTHILQQAWSK